LIVTLYVRNQSTMSILGGVISFQNYYWGNFFYGYSHSASILNLLHM